MIWISFIDKIDKLNKNVQINLFLFWWVKLLSFCSTGVQLYNQKKCLALYSMSDAVETDGKKRKL